MKEAFSYGHAGFDESSECSQLPENPLEGPNIWPPGSSPGVGEPAWPGVGLEWRARLNAVFAGFAAAAQEVSQALALALGMQPAQLGQVVEGGDTISLMRLFHYLPYHVFDRSNSSRGSEVDREQAMLERIGSSPHTGELRSLQTLRYSLCIE